MLSVERARKGWELVRSFCGLGVIVAACLLNIMYDRLAGSGVFPVTSANMYATSGKAGVTVTVVRRPVDHDAGLGDPTGAPAIRRRPGASSGRMWSPVHPAR